MDRLDRAIGDSITAAVRAKHRRRLARLRQLRARCAAGGWAEDAPPPRPDNRVDVLIDGEAALAEIVDEIRGARSHVHLTGWFMSPDFVLRDSERPVVLRNLLAEMARRADVRVLLWAGAPVPVFRPSRRTVRRVREEPPAGGADRLRSGRARTAASLPSREDDRHRRSSGVRRRHRPDELRRRPPRRKRPSGAGAARLA